MTRPKRPKRPPRKRQLTELSVRKAQPEPAAYLIWDARQHGLALQVQPTGSKAWKAIYSRYGRPRWLHLGNASAIGLADARTLAGEAMLKVAKGQDPAAEKRAERGAGTFAELPPSTSRSTPRRTTSRGGKPTPWSAATFCRGGGNYRRRRSRAATSRQ